MRGINNTPSTLLKTFSSIYPISQHPSHTMESEYSDKIVLPKSIYYIIRNTHYPIPPIFILRSAKFPEKFVFCGVSEFTSEETVIYCPTWIIRKVAKRGKYSSIEVRLEILQTSQNKPYIFPLLSKIDLALDSDIEVGACRRALMNYTVINKGENLAIFVKKGEILRAFVANTLPKNRCLVKSNNFEINLIKKTVQNTVTEEDERESRPMIEYFQISLLMNSRVFDRRRQESHTPWEHQVRPIKIEGESINLLPWENQTSPPEDENFIEKFTQALPELPSVSQKPLIPPKSKPKKKLNLAFPTIFTDSRPLTTVNKQSKLKSISYSPVNKF